MNIGEAKCIFHRLTTSYRRQSKTLILLTRVDKKILGNRVFDCHLSPDWRQMAIKNTASIVFLSVFVDNVKSDFDCGLSRVLTNHTGKCMPTEL